MIFTKGSATDESNANGVEVMSAADSGEEAGAVS